MFAVDVFRRFAERDIAAAIWLGKLNGISQSVKMGWTRFWRKSRHNECHR